MSGTYHEVSEKIAADIIVALEKIDRGAIAQEISDEIKTALKGEILQPMIKQISSDVREDMLLKVPSANIVEAQFERFLFGSRWLMSVAYLAMVALMVGLVFLICLEVKEFFWQMYKMVFESQDSKNLNLTALVVAIVDILDLMLLGSLLVMVLIGGYENTISRISKSDNTGPTWVGNLDFSHLKIKVAASIVLISGVHLLKIFLDLARAQQVQPIFDWNVFWSVVIHIVFILSALMLAYMDKILSSVNYDH